MAGTLTVEDMRDIVRSAGRRLGDTATFPDTDVDDAFAWAANLWMERVRRRDTFTHDLTAGSSAVDLTSTTATFDLGRLLKVSGQYKNIGAWSDAGVSYSVDQVVTNDGSAYRCIQAHTSSALNEPPNTSFWSKTDPNYQWDMEQWSYDQLAQELELNAQAESTGTDPVKFRTSAIAFETADVAIVYPRPQVVYTLKVLWMPTLIAWTFGADASTVLNLPNDDVRIIARWAAPAVLEFPELRDSPYTAGALQMFFREMERKAAQSQSGTRRRSTGVHRGYGNRW